MIIEDDNLIKEYKNSLNEYEKSNSWTVVDVNLYKQNINIKY